MGLIEDVGPGPVGIDTAPFIYLIEEHPRFLPVVIPVFEAIQGGRLRAATSSLTLMEVLVVPYRAGNLDLASAYEELLTRSGGLGVIDVDPPILRAAAHLRARYPSLRTPDALQLAAALAARCTTFLTNDRRLPDLPGLRVLSLDAYLPPAGAGARPRRVRR